MQIETDLAAVLLKQKKKDTVRDKRDNALTAGKTHVGMFWFRICNTGTGMLEQGSFNSHSKMLWTRRL